MKYTVIEMQDGIIGEHSWTYGDRASADVKMYQVLAEAVKSPVAVHTVMLVTEGGTVRDVRSYEHGGE